jgi:internalin A
MDLYWDNEIRYKDKDDPELQKYIRRYDTSKQKDIPNTKKDEQELFAAQVLAYIDEKMSNRADAKIVSPDDMYLSVDGKYFVHHKYLETRKEHQDRITVYPVRETEDEITDATDRGTEKKRKIEVIDTGTPKTLPVYPFKNFSNNPNLKSMKKIFISYSNNDVKYMEELMKHLRPLSVFGIAYTWNCEQITVEKWHERIQKELEESDLIIYMLSANFFSSSYILDEEVKRGMFLAGQNPGKKVLCVAVSKFVGLDKLKEFVNEENLDDLQKAVLQLADWQCWPYDETGNSATSNDERKIIPLKSYELRRIDEAYAQIAEKVLNVLGEK